VGHSALAVAVAIHSAVHPMCEKVRRMRLQDLYEGGVDVFQVNLSTDLCVPQFSSIASLGIFGING
jgi:hypothetical protein